jgi:predicted small integral membrane protein
VWNIAYLAIIVWESAAAILLVLATALLIAGMVRGGFRTARALSSIGLLMIVVLFFGGFIAVGGEWFGMWRSTQWNGLDTAFRNGMLAAVALILIHVPVAGWSRRSTTVRS